ncbi:MAG: CsgG/HfaB family protein [Brevinematales bacterium]|jgi:TolB-like protein
MAKYLLAAFLILILSCRASCREVLSVLYFDNTAKNPDIEWIGKGLADLLTTDIAQSADVIVVERQQLDKILEEQKLSLSGLADEHSAVEVGRLLNATKLVAGSYIVQDSLIRIDAKIIDTTTGRLESVKAAGDIGDIFAIEGRLSGLIYEKLILKKPSGSIGPAEAIGTSSPDAFRSYYQGVAYLDAGLTDKAVDSFRMSSEQDPLYAKPQKGLEEAYKFLKDFKKLRYQREINSLYDRFNQFRARIYENPFITYSELLKQADTAHMTAEQMQNFNKAHETYILASTPAQCVWQMQITLFDIDTRQENYRREENLTNNDSGKQLLLEIVSLAENARVAYNTDPQIPDIVYLEILALKQLKEYARLKDYSEKFLTDYPDYRMIEFIEDMYKEALDKLKEETN